MTKEEKLRQIHQALGTVERVAPVVKEGLQHVLDAETLDAFIEK